MKAFLKVFSALTGIVIALGFLASGFEKIRKRIQEDRDAKLRYEIRKETRHLR